MSGSDKTYKAPPNSEEVHLGRTLPSLLDEACDRFPNSMALNQWTRGGWQPLSNQAFRTAAEELALGLLALKLERGDRVALLMHSDVNFCIADMGCLLAGLVDVPIDLAQTPENAGWILQHTGAKALIVSDLDLLCSVIRYLGNAANLKLIIVADVPQGWQPEPLFTWEGNGEEKDRNTYLQPNGSLHCPDTSSAFLSTALRLFSLTEVRIYGQTQWSEANAQQLRSRLAPTDLATIIYTAGVAGRPRGAMLTHENLSGNILAAFAAIPDLVPGEPEVALSFLPLTHVFARAFLYAHFYYSHRIYFTTPVRMVKYLRDVQPIILATVPRLLEEIYQKILEAGAQQQGLNRVIFQWALSLAQQYQLGQKPKGCYALQLAIADPLVFRHWRSALGGRLKYLISGGAALKPDLANIFAAAGLPVLQGYGLTESGSVICFNRGEWNRAGTVGMPIAGVEVAIAADGEILTRSPYVMQGYYQNPEATQEAIDAEGWLHTGDIGEFTAEGFLKITDTKKDLFKLSTGKYVMPQPLETKLQQSPLVDHAVAVGPQRKFCALLIFANLEALKAQAARMGFEDIPENVTALFNHPKIKSFYQKLVDAANQGLPHWSTAKRFRLIHAALTVENGLLTPELKVRRGRVNQVFAAEIDAIYTETAPATTAQPPRLAPTGAEALVLETVPIPAKTRWQKLNALRIPGNRLPRFH